MEQINYRQICINSLSVFMKKLNKEYIQCVNDYMYEAESCSENELLAKAFVRYQVSIALSSVIDADRENQLEIEVIENAEDMIREINKTLCTGDIQTCVNMEYLFECPAHVLPLLECLKAVLTIEKELL